MITFRKRNRKKKPLKRSLKRNFICMGTLKVSIFIRKQSNYSFSIVIKKNEFYRIISADSIVFAKGQHSGVATSYILATNNYVQLFLITCIAENSEYLAIQELKIIIEKYQYSKYRMLRPCSISSEIYKKVSILIILVQMKYESNRVWQHC